MKRGGNSNYIQDTAENKLESSNVRLPHTYLRETATHVQASTQDCHTRFYARLLRALLLPVRWSQVPDLESGDLFVLHLPTTTPFKKLKQHVLCSGHY